VPTEAIMTFGIANNEWDVWMQHDWINLLIVVQHPMKPFALQIQESQLFQDKLDLHVHLIKEIGGPAHVWYQLHLYPRICMAVW
jgi:hypothetical protein